MCDASSLLFHLTSSSRRFSVPPQGTLFQPKSIPRRPFCGLSGGAKRLKSYKKPLYFQHFQVPTFRCFWMLQTSKMHFREPSGARSGNAPSPLGPFWRAFRFSAAPPRGPQDTSGRQFDVPKHPRSHLERPPRIPRYPQRAKV